MAIKAPLKTLPAKKVAAKPVLSVVKKVSGAVPAKKVAGKPELSVVKKGFPARKPGAVARVRKPLPTFKAPADFKPYFLLVQAVTERDGLFSNNIKAVRYQGRFDREADQKKKFDLSTYDQATLLGITARLAAVTYKATNDKKWPTLPTARVGVKGSNRLPASTTFQILMRVGKKAADGSLTCGIKQIWQLVRLVSGRDKLKELLKTDPVYRHIRKASRVLPAAFTQTQLPPKRTRGTKLSEEESD